MLHPIKLFVLVALAQHLPHLIQCNFPGVSKDIAPFCAARPSLPIDMASMVVHLKKNTSFNYKLYLLSGDNVFQTGQIIPRDDFRIHSFPVKLKRLNDFWPTSVNTYELKSETGRAQVENYHFNIERFFAPVPLHPQHYPAKHSAKRELEETFDLPGEESPSNSSYGINSYIDFDRDDQISVARLPSYMERLTAPGPVNQVSKQATTVPSSELIVPVGSFSSFHVNLTYLVRKDFDQLKPELVQLQVDADRFLVTELVLITNTSLKVSQVNIRSSDYEFLAHKLLMDPNTRITSINQIYEDWITRNLYTIVYIQRRLDDDSHTGQQIVSNRLIFRGTSVALLGADQLDYDVKAAAFITEKNGLHYYLEFLSTSKFYLCAIDWTKRPFKIIDSRRFPIKATRTELDNEELLLCPPAVCYSSQPLDEVVNYGRLPNLHGLPNFGGPSNDSARYKMNNRQLDTKLHLRDWSWSLRRSNQAIGLSNRVARKALFRWQYESAKRNDIKANQDAYGYALTGHEIDASYRVTNELFLVSANHLIVINYTLPNETVLSRHPIGDEFPGLSSTVLDPITGAFYDRRLDQIYFFKGDRYIGFDYASKRALEDFTLPFDGMDELLTAAGELPTTIWSLPVVGILGRQYQVDGVFHDLSSDLVYIFSGMKFQFFHVDDFRNGSFQTKSHNLPQMYCINEYFLDGCLFDKVFPNPCKNDPTQLPNTETLSKNKNNQHSTAISDTNSAKEEEFRIKQQTRLRSVALRPILMKLLVNENEAKSHLLNDVSFTSNNSSMKEMKARSTILVLTLVALLSVLFTGTLAIFLLFKWTCQGKRIERNAAVNNQINEFTSIWLERYLSMSATQQMAMASGHHLSHFQQLPHISEMNNSKEQQYSFQTMLSSVRKQQSSEPAMTAA